MSSFEGKQQIVYGISWYNYIASYLSLSSQWNDLLIHKMTLILTFNMCMMHIVFVKLADKSEFLYTCVCDLVTNNNCLVGNYLYTTVIFQ